MKYVLSGLNCKSVTVSICARSLFKTSSPVFASKSATFPDSWPVMMSDGMWAKAQTTALLPVGLKNETGSFDSSRSNSAR